MATLSREQLQEARLQARVKRQEEIDKKHAEIQELRERGVDTEELERELEKLYDDYNDRRNARREAKKAARIARTDTGRNRETACDSLEHYGGGA